MKVGKLKAIQEKERHYAEVNGEPRKVKGQKMFKDIFPDFDAMIKEVTLYL